MVCAPYATEELAETVVATDVRINLYSRMGAGRYLMTGVDPETFRATLQLFDLNAGTRLRYVLPDDWRATPGTGPFWVTNEEVAFAAHNLAGEVTVLRIQLGAFEVVP